MKKTLLLLCLLISVSAFAQNSKNNKEARASVREVKTITFYGVDYSQTKVYGASETPGQFRSAFYEINQLFVSEAKKYNVAKALKRNFVETNLESVLGRISKLGDEDIITQSADYTISQEGLQKIVNSIEADTSEENSLGLVIVAELLNKSKNKGTQHVVFFDPASKEIVYTYKLQNKAVGFGLRNFWARCVYSTLQNMKNTL